MSFFLDFIAENAFGTKALPLENPVTVDVGLAWKKDRYISKAAQAFIDFCSTTLKERNVSPMK